jgi:transposase
MARPSKYIQDNWNEKLEVIKGWARDGLVNEQIASNIGISTGTLYEYKKRYPKFNEALKKGKEVIDYEVENALLKKALSGDVTAQIFWLKNRRPNQWRDKRVIDQKVSIENASQVKIELVDDDS